MRFPAMRQIVFIQGGGGHGVHDQWDDKLVASLKRELGDGFEVRYPHMPDEDDPKYAKWKPAILREVDALDDGAMVVGHSIGGTMLVNALAEEFSCGGRSPEFSTGSDWTPAFAGERRLAAIVLIGAPFVGEGGWPAQEFEPKRDLGASLPEGVPVHLFHGDKDETAPPAHAGLYAKAIPQAEVHRLPGRDHQLNNDLGEVRR